VKNFPVLQHTYVKKLTKPFISTEFWHSVDKVHRLAAKAASLSSLSLLPLLPPGGRTRRILWTICPRSRGHSCSRSEHLTHAQTWPQFKNSTVDWKTHDSLWQTLPRSCYRETALIQW